MKKQIFFSIIFPFIIYETFFSFSFALFLLQSNLKFPVVWRSPSSASLFLPLSCWKSFALFCLVLVVFWLADEEQRWVL